MNIQLADIKVNGRFRKDLGDIRALASSIAELGLMHPIVINEDNQLIAGQRRLEACKLLAWKEIPVTVLSIKEIVTGELHENIARKDFTMSERFAILDEIERQRIGHKISKAKGDKLSPFQKDSKGRKSRSIVSQFTGISEGQLQKEKLILKAAQDNPVKFSQLVHKIDNGKMSVDGAYKEVRDELWRAQQLANTENLRLASNFRNLADKLNLLEGDFIEQAGKLIADSVDLIFTDPPYDEKNLSLYKDLGIMAHKLLRPGGSLITYIGQYAWHRILDLIEENSELKLWWTFCIQLQGPFPRYFDRQFVVKWKPLLWFVKGSRPSNPSFPKLETAKRNFLSDLIISKTPGKRFHKWGQSCTEAEYCIKFLTQENDLILDPFLGEGTTALACMKLNRKFVGIDINPKALEFTRANLLLNLSA